MRIPVNIKRFFIVLFISFLIIFLIIYFTSSKKTLDDIRMLKPKFIFLAIIFYLTEFSADALRTKILVSGTKNRISFWECYKLVALQVFFDLITPFNIGGQPFQIYALHKKKVPGGSATTVVILKLIMGALVLLSIIIFGLLFYSDLFTETAIFMLFFKITGFLLLFIFILFLIGIYNPDISTNILSFIISKIKIIRNKKKFEQKINKHLILAKESLQGLISHKILYLLAGFILTFVMTISTALIILSFIWGFNIKLGIIEGIILSSMLIFIITFMPTPGSSGLGEGVFYVMFNIFVPNHLIGVLIFLWRFFTQYFTAILGAIITALYFSELLKNKRIAQSG